MTLSNLVGECIKRKDAVCSNQLVDDKLLKM